MCEQCTAKTVDYGSPLPGWYLVRATVDGWFMKKDQWGLVRQNDPDFCWNPTPIPDPYKGLDEDDDCNLSRFLDKDFLKGYEEFWPELQASPKAGYELIVACEKSGYEQKSGSVEYWLFDYLGRYLQNYNK